MKVSGNIKDVQNETLPGANIFISDSTGKPLTPLNGTKSDVNGNYVLEADQIHYNQYVSVSYVGFKTVTKSIPEIASTMLPKFEIAMLGNVPLDINIPLNVTMMPQTEEIPTFEVVAKRSNKKWIYYAIGGLLLAIIGYFALKKR